MGWEESFSLCHNLSLKLKFCFISSLCFCHVLETLSEAVKLLKGEYCLRAIIKHKMDRAIIFCRTKLDCDNLEKYFNQMGKIIVTTYTASNIYNLFQK